MKTCIAFLLGSFFTFGSTNSTACSQWEYAKFKDATRKELAEEYCYAKNIAVIDGKMADGSNELIKQLKSLGADDSKLEQHKQELKKHQDDKILCLTQVDESANMLMKKFRAKPPACKD